jgi:hypothetical protein
LATVLYGLDSRGVPGHWVSVCAFDVECRSVARLETGDIGLAKAVASVDTLRPDGKQTALLDAIDHCYGLLSGYPERIKRLVILTDGADTISAKCV